MEFRDSKKVVFATINRTIFIPSFSSRAELRDSGRIGWLDTAAS
jgi:hypothetical protein